MTNRPSRNFSKGVCGLSNFGESPVPFESPGRHGHSGIRGFSASGSTCTGGRIFPAFHRSVPFSRNIFGEKAFIPMPVVRIARNLRSDAAV
jgi:hypothetical protein